MGAIAFSYPVSIVLNKFIFQIEYFQTLNFIAVFVILGISADNVFVFIDSWQQTEQYEKLNQDEDKYKNFQKRMNHTWRGATKAVSTTSFTTIMAFIATGFSKIMPISAFGFFAATLVAVNYVFAIVTFPACLIFFERHLAHRCRYRKFIGEK
jgi:predicted RND superfamily exporter protein